MIHPYARLRNILALGLSALVGCHLIGGLDEYYEISDSSGQGGFGGLTGGAGGAGANGGSAGAVPNGGTGTGGAAGSGGKGGSGIGGIGGAAGAGGSAGTGGAAGAAGVGGAAGIGGGGGVGGSAGAGVGGSSGAGGGGATGGTGPVVSKLQQTGQTSCYYRIGSGGGANWFEDPTCGAIGGNGGAGGQSGPYVVGDPARPFGQDAHYTHLSVPRSFTGPYKPGAPDEYVTADLVTNLVWMSCYVGQSGSLCTGAPATKSFSQAGPACAGSSYADINDWRVPSAAELLTIVDFSDPNGTPNALFPNSYMYAWTSEADPTNPGSEAIRIYEQTGGVSAELQSLLLAVRCVSGPALSYHSYQDNADGTITSIPTGLTWNRCVVGTFWDGLDCTGQATQLTWSQALTECENSTASGHADWRLPNALELTSLVDYSLTTMADPRLDAGGLWSSTTPPTLPDRAYLQNFYQGAFFFWLRDDVPYFNARCVRNE